jgi:hypothetical protein
VYPVGDDVGDGVAVEGLAGGVESCGLTGGLAAPF